MPECSVQEQKANRSVYPIRFSIDLAASFLKSLHCRDCGKCCRNAYVEEDERLRIASYSKITIEQLRTKLRKGCLPDPCCFRGENGCEIYPVKPINCSLFPISPYLMEGEVIPRLSVWTYCAAGQELDNMINESRRKVTVEVLQ